MTLVWIIGLVILLYARTLTYKYCIDDNVKRNGYMYEVPLTAPPADLYFSAPSKAYRCFMIGMHCVNVSIIYMLWGWCPALLFAVHPMCVWGVAWVTGNYYATTAYFCLISYYIIHTFPNVWGALVAMPIFAAALNSTICCVSFPFIFLLTGNVWGCALFIPLAIYLRGKRFTTGIKTRDSFNENKPLKTQMTYKRFFLCIKVMARYILDVIYPNKIGLFTPYGHRIKDKEEVYSKWQSPNSHFWASLAICAVTFIGGMLVSPIGTLWFFTVIALHSQWRLTGQFYAQRYLYLAMPGFCVVVGLLIQSNPVLISSLVTFLVLRTHIYIPAWKNQECLYKNDLETFPEYGQVYNNLSQYYLNANSPTNPMPAFRLNELGALLFQAEMIENDDWSIKMNIACFFSLVGQWPMCKAKTLESLKIIKPLGGPQQPVKMLEDQLVTIDRNIAKMPGANVSLGQFPDGRK